MKGQKETEELLELLYPLEGKEKSMRRFVQQRRKKMVTAGVALGVLFVALCRRASADGLLTEDGRILRPSYGTLQVQLSAEANELQTSVELSVRAKKLTGAELFKAMEEAKELVEERVKGENPSLREITTKLNLCDSVEEYDMEVVWNTSGCPQVHSDGTVDNQTLTVPVDGFLMARLIYEGESAEWEIPVRILPLPYSEEEQFAAGVNELLEQSAKACEEESYFELPSEYAGETISWKEESKIPVTVFLAMGMLVLLLLYQRETSKLKEEAKQREKELLTDYPEFLSRLLLLLGAGMTVRGAWERMLSEGTPAKEKRAVYQEMTRTMTQLEVGMAEPQAYEQFGRRCGALPYLRFVTILNQNLKKGSTRLAEQLQLEAKEAFSERKQQVRQQGEEAGTKLLLPMGGMLLLVLVLLLVPAFASFHGM